MSNIEQRSALPIARSYQKSRALPDVYQITPDPGAVPDVERFLSELTETLRSGIQLVQLRTKRLAKREHLEIAQRTQALCRLGGAQLILNGPIEMAMEVGCDGVHLSSDTLMSLTARPASSSLLISAACHSATQLAQAARIQADFVTLSPVLPTKTHPEAAPLGWQRFEELVAGTEVPVFALGGMNPGMLDQAKAAGAYGVAAISATWRHQGPVLARPI